MYTNNIFELSIGVLWFVHMILYHNSNLKYYFSVFASTQFIALLAQGFFNTDPTLILIVGYVLLVFSFYSRATLLKNLSKDGLIIASAFLIAAIFNYSKIVIPILTYMVLWKLQKIAVVDYLKNEKINPFFVMLVAFQILTLLYYVLILAAPEIQPILNIIFTICQGILLLLTILLRKNKKPLIAKLSLSP